MWLTKNDVAFFNFSASLYGHVDEFATLACESLFLIILLKKFHVFLWLLPMLYLPPLPAGGAATVAIVAAASATPTTISHWRFKLLSLPLHQQHKTSLCPSPITMDLRRWLILKDLYVSLFLRFVSSGSINNIKRFKYFSIVFKYLNDFK